MITRTHTERETRVADIRQWHALHRPTFSPDRPGTMREKIIADTGEDHEGTISALRWHQQRMRWVDIDVLLETIDVLTGLDKLPRRWIIAEEGGTIVATEAEVLAIKLGAIANRAPAASDRRFVSRELFDAVVGAMHGAVAILEGDD
jgi:hypothetical protein